MVMFLLATLIAYWADAEYGSESVEGTLCSWVMCLALIATGTPATWDLAPRMGIGAVVALILVLGFDKVSSRKDKINV